MEYLITRAEPNAELTHWGIKGQKWGQRRYQNKDGSLTPAGQKRYNKEVEKLKKETAKLKAEQKVIATKKKNQEKIDKLESKKKALEDQKKALRDEKRGKKSDNIDSKTKGRPEETLDEKRARLLKSTDPKELFEGKDALSNIELQERINRINLESQLQSKVPTEVKKSTMDYINDSIAMYKKVDEAYSTVANSAIGKTIGKKLGLMDEKTEVFDFDKFRENRDKMSINKLKEADERLRYYKNMDDEADRRSGKKTDKLENLDDFVADIENKSAKELKEMSEALSNKEKIINKKERYDKKAADRRQDDDEDEDE